jgi:fatty-acyl-CoA synthase
MALLIGDIVRRAARMAPRAVAASLGGERVSFGELDEAADRTANALAGLGVRRGDRVVWWSAPALRTLDGFLGCARLGAVFAPVNPALSDVEFAAVVDYLDPRLVVTDAERAGVAAPHAVAATLCGAPGTPRAAVSETDPHILYLTSGSTGRPKGALVSHRASWLRAAPGGGTFSTGLRGDGGVLCSFPLYHYGGWHYVMEAWQHRTAAHLVPRADAVSIVDAVRRHRPAAIYCIPAVWERLLDGEHRRADLSSLRHADTGTSAVAAELVARIKERLPGTTTTILYGSTEAGRMAALQDWELARRPGSVGRPAFPGTLWLDGHGDSASHGCGNSHGDGEVVVGGDTLMSGYHGLPDETVAALRGGAYRSGDLGRLDDDGYLYLTGRTREVIRSGGESVSPSEVEYALRDLPGVRDVAVVGLPDTRWGEVVCAAVVPAGDRAVPDVAAVRAHVAGRLAPFKQPRRIAVVDAIPRTPATGQIQRSRVREAILAAGS